jgi:hypothetical protein
VDFLRLLRFGYDRNSKQYCCDQDRQRGSLPHRTPHFERYVSREEK